MSGREAGDLAAARKRGLRAGAACIGCAGCCPPGARAGGGRTATGSAGVAGVAAEGPAPAALAGSAFLAAGCTKTTMKPDSSMPASPTVASPLSRTFPRCTSFIASFGNAGPCEPSTPAFSSATVVAGSASSWNVAPLMRRKVTFMAAAAAY